MEKAKCDMRSEGGANTTGTGVAECGTRNGWEIRGGVGHWVAMRSGRRLENERIEPYEAMPA